MRIAILGAAGNAGHLLAQQLAPQLDAHAELLLVGRREAPLAALCEQINHQAGRALAHTACADFTDLPRMRTLLTGSQLVVVTAALGKHTAPLAALVLEAGADWLDIMLSTPSKCQALTALAPAITQQGRCFITDGGFHPGRPACRHGALGGEPHGYADSGRNLCRTAYRLASQYVVRFHACRGARRIHRL